MLTTLVLFLTYSLEWSYCSTGQILEDRYNEKSVHKHAATASGSFNLIQNRNLNHSRRASGNVKGREIIEISSADPTTDSTLILPHYPIDCANERECALMASINAMETTPLPTFKPYTQEELDLFIKNYVNTHGKLPSETLIGSDNANDKLTNIYMDDGQVNILESLTTKDEGKSQASKASWHLMQSQTHKHPYDDHTGWVSLEPVAWSSSQVQKWEPNSRPQHLPHWMETGSNDQQPQSSWNKPTTSWQDRPWNKKPTTYEYKPNEGGSSKPPSAQWNDYASGNMPWGGSSSHPDIITDSSPSHFPHSDGPTKKPTWYERPQSSYQHGDSEHYQNGQQHHHHHTGVHPSTHPAEGDGRWVLLSSTKGYSVPQRNRAYRRALYIDTKLSPSEKQHTIIPTLKSHRTVRLTVLPPLNGTKNTTTSYGGLLEVEKTALTVDEAQREHAAKIIRQNESQLNQLAIDKRQVVQQQQNRKRSTIKIYPVKDVTSLDANSKAMLAAVGAGMIPATMAMLVPMVLGRKRRSLAASSPVIHYRYLSRIHDSLQ